MKNPHKDFITVLPPDPAEELAYITVIRRKMRLNISDFARLLGIKLPALCHYERGIRKPPLDFFPRLHALAWSRKVKFDMIECLTDCARNKEGWKQHWASLEQKSNDTQGLTHDHQ